MDTNYDPYSEDKAKPSDELYELIQQNYGIDARLGVDLGGSYNLNLHASDAVIRVYQPYVTPERLLGIQKVRQQLTSKGIPCSQVISTKDGRTWLSIGRSVLEVERFVEKAEKMDSWERLESGLSCLGRIHTLLKEMNVSEEVKKAPVANHVEAERAFSWTLRGTSFVRNWKPTPTEMQFANNAEKLANLLAEAESDFLGKLPRQLVHGDFWDNNVFMKSKKVVYVADFDFMGERARIDDIALTLFYKNSTTPGDQTSQERIMQLRRLVDAYDSGLEDHLTEVERKALPIAIARAPLCFVGIIASVTKEQGQREVLKRANDLVWALQLVGDLRRWQYIFG